MSADIGNILAEFPDEPESDGVLIAILVERNVQDDSFLDDCVRKGYVVETTVGDIKRLKILYQHGHKVPIVTNGRANWFFVRDRNGRRRPIGFFADGKKGWDIKVYREKSKGGLSFGSHVMVLKK